MDYLTQSLTAAKKAQESAVDALRKATKEKVLPNEHLAKLIVELTDKLFEIDSREFSIQHPEFPKRKPGR